MRFSSSIFVVFLIACDARSSSATEASATAPSVQRGAGSAGASSAASDATAVDPRQVGNANDPNRKVEPEAKPVVAKVVAPDGTEALPCREPAPKGMACIPGGPFIRGSDDGPENTRPKGTVWVQTFYMDLYEVTYAQYGACMKAQGCNRARPRYTDYDHPNMPMTGINWYDAVKYCELQGKRLPTEAQWEKAARGPDGHLYPWGDEPVTCERAIYRDASGRGCGLKKQFSKPETGRPWDVGSRPAGVYGLFDMVGNSWEWVDDWYSSNWTKCGAECEGVDPKGPCGGGANPCNGHHSKIVRGGSWYWEDEKATGIYRRHHVPNNDPFHHFGFRCAATADDAAKLPQ